MRVGYVVKMFPRLSETFILNEILEHERKGVEVVIFSLKKPNEGRFHPQLSQLKATVYYLEDLDPKKWQNWISPEWEALSQYKENLWSLVEETIQAQPADKVDNVWWSAWIAARASVLGLDRLHAHFASIPSTLAYMAHRISGIPYSFTAHAKDIFVYTMDEHHLREKLQTATPVVTVTHFNKRFLINEAAEVNPDHIKVIHNGIDLSLFKPNYESRHEHMILGVGRMVVKKGFDYLLQACQRLKEAGTKFECILAGDGPEKENLEEMIIDLNLTDCVTMVGAKNLDEVRELMNKATVFCLPCVVAEDNNQDALPTVLLESLACGLPIVSTNISGIPEIVDNEENGLLVDANDDGALAVALTRLLDAPDLRETYAHKGREKAERCFDLSKNVGTLLTTFEENLNNYRATNNKSESKAVSS